MLNRLFRKIAIPFVTLSLLISAFVPTMVLAAAAPALPYEDVRKKYGFEDQLGGMTFSQIVGRVISWVLPVTGSLLLFMFLYGGFLWFTAGGSADRVKKATQTMVNAAIGMAIIVGAYVLVNTLVEKLGNAMTGGT